MGERLRGGNINDDDLAMLDEFRQTFSNVDEQVYQLIHSALASTSGWTVTKRKRKTQQSIIDKLRRQPELRLPQMQDIAGWRIVIEGGTQMAGNINTVLTHAFDFSWHVQSKDRHAHGYCAIHIILKQDGKFYEIQLRTYAQDIWANLIESLSDERNTLKYGGSEQERTLIDQLERLSERFGKADQCAHEASFTHYQQQIKEAIRNVLSH